MTSPPHGSAAEEAARLLEVLQGWLARGGSAAGASADASAGGSPECRLCPVCRLLATLRQSRPEVLEHLGVAAAALSAAVTELVVAHEHEPSARPSPGVERIDIT